MAVVIEKSGWLARQQQGTLVGRGWRSKWVVLRGELLQTFASAQSEAPPEETAGLKDATVGPVAQPDTPGNKPFGFCVITAEDSRLFFAADDEAERNEWVSVLNHAIALASTVVAPAEEVSVLRTVSISVPSSMCGCERCESKLRSVLDKFVSTATDRDFEYEIDSPSETVVIRFRQMPGESSPDEIPISVIDALTEIGFFANVVQR